MSKKAHLSRSFLVVLCGILFGSVMALSSSALSSFPPKGSAATPLSKKKVAVLGSGGYMGGLVFGFLQRAASLYGTGMASPCTIVATAASSVALNSLLSRHFLLAQAHESFVKLTDMTDVVDIERSLKGCDAVILGANILSESRPVTFGTFEKSPNDKTTEFYWDGPSSRDFASLPFDVEYSKQVVLANTLEACRRAKIQHAVVVDATRDGDDTVFSMLQQQDENVAVPYTYVRPLGDLQSLPNYTYQKGVQRSLRLLESAASPLQLPPIYREDVAAFCVQCLMSLDWATSRSLQVTCQEETGNSGTGATSGRLDREWCVGSMALAETLAGVA